MPANGHWLVFGQMNITFVYALRFTPAAVAAFQPSVCQVVQSQPVVVAGIVYQPNASPVTVMRPLDSSSRKAFALVLLPVRAFRTVAFVYGWVARLVKLIRTTAMLLATGAAAVAVSRLVVVTVAVDEPVVPSVPSIASTVAVSPARGARVTRKLRPAREDSTRSALPTRVPVTVTMAPPYPSGPPSANSSGITPPGVRSR